MHIDDIKRGLRAEIKKRENEQYATFQCNVRQMCKDVLAKLEEQETEIQRLENLCESYRIDCDNLAIREANAYKEIGRDNKLIRLQKYNRCLLRSVIAEMKATHFKDLFYGASSEVLADEYNQQITIHYKWQKRWLDIAQKFKEAK